MKSKFYLAAGIVLMLAFVILLGTAAAQPALPCDTANIQCAFDLANATGPGMTVYLKPGTFHTAQIVVYNFDGAFRGSSVRQTEIVNLPNLPVSTDHFFFFNPPSAANPHPTLFSFIGTNLKVSKMALRILGQNPTDPWYLGDYGPLTELGCVMMITGSESHVQVSDILIQGEAQANSTFGYNTNNGIYFEGTIGETPPPLSGSFTVTNSTFRTIAAGSPIYNLVDASVKLSHNRYEDVFYGMDGSELQNSRIELTHNFVDSVLFGIDLWPSITGVDSGTSFLIANNTVRAVYGIAFEQTLGEGTTCLVKVNNLKGVTDTPIFLGPGAESCVLKNNKE